ncbi:hypothetical protein E2320_014274, partial [Naja naja]
SPSHSLCYSYLHLSEPSQELSQFSIRGYLDDQPIARFDSLTKKMEPLVPWMEEEAEKEETFQVLEWAVLGCELKEDGSKGGFLHYGYNGMDFISFDKEPLRWVAAQPQAQKVKEKWEVHPGVSQRKKFYLEKTCIEWLQRYQSYKKEAPERIEPPVGKVNSKVVDERLEVLTCQAFGFYPKEIQAIWTRDGEACVYETIRRNVAPHSDGTYYVRLSIEIDPKEGDLFQCHLEHEGLKEPLVLALKKTASIWGLAVGVLAATTLGAGIFFLICWRCMKKRHQEHTTSSVRPFSRNGCFSHESIEDEIQQAAVVDCQTPQKVKILFSEEAEEQVKKQHGQLSWI